MGNRAPTIASISIALAAYAAAAAAAPPIIEDAKANCVIGEQADGYLGVIDENAASDTLEREVRAINQQRKAAYANLAARNGVTIEDAALLTAEKLLNGAPSGHCIQLADGEWMKKP